MTQTNFLKTFLERVTSSLKIEKALMPKADVIQHVKHYRTGIGGDAIKSAWINRELIDFIIAHDHEHIIDGFRVYLAKYKEGVNPVPSDPKLKDLQTIIVVPTFATIDPNRHTDIENAYFNYGKPCPPSCRDDDDVIK